MERIGHSRSVSESRHAVPDLRMLGLFKPPHQNGRGLALRRNA